MNFSWHFSGIPGCSRVWQPEHVSSRPSAHFARPDSSDFGDVSARNRAICRRVKIDIEVVELNSFLNFFQWWPSHRHGSGRPPERHRRPPSNNRRKRAQSVISSTSPEEPGRSTGPMSATTGFRKSSSNSSTRRPASPAPTCSWAA